MWTPRPDIDIMRWRMDRKETEDLLLYEAPRMRVLPVLPRSVILGSIEDLEEGDEIGDD